MASEFTKGESIYFLFKLGKTVQDSQHKPRYYLNRAVAEMYLPYGNEIVEYAPVRHGRWIFDAENYEWNCSECHEWPIDGSADDERTYYCPNCGAKMDAEG